MQKHYNYLNIDLDKKIHTKLKAKQGDSKSRYILVNLISNSTYYDLSDCAVKIYGIKKDKTIFFNHATVTNAKQGQFEIELTTQALAVVGEIEIQILILGTNQEKLTTFSFFIDVEKTIIDDTAIESTNEFTALTKALSSVQNIDNKFAKVDEQFNTIDNKIDEVATTGTTIETVHNKISEMAQDGTITFDTVTPEMTSFINVDKSINLFNPKNSNTGYYYSKDSTGNITLNANSNYTCFTIEITATKTYTVSASNYAIYFSKIGSTIAEGYLVSTDTTTFTLSGGRSGKYLAYISFRHDKLPINQYMFVEGDSLPQSYIPYYVNNTIETNVKVDYNSLINIPYNVDEIYTVGIGKDYSTLTECIRALKDNHNSKVIYIDGGEYNIFDEIGGSEFALSITESITNWRDVSDIVPDNTKIIGIGEVILNFYPSTSEISTQGARLLSCLNVIYENFYMENVTVICGNCRYGIHDETGGTYIGAVHRYKNVKVYKKSIAMGMTQAFGCGFSPRQLLEFDGCHFEGSRYPFSCHNNGSNDVDNAIINAKNTIFNATSTDINSIRFGNVNSKQVKVSVNLTNCFIKNKIQVVNETSTTERPNAFDITLLNCNDTQVEILNTTNIYQPEIFK